METITKTAGKTATNDNSVANAKAVRTISLKQQLTKAEKDSKKVVPTLTLKDEPITFQLAKTGERVSKKIAFVENNRTVNTKKVDEFIAIIDNGKYEEAYPIIVVEAVDLIKAGYTVTDVNGKVLTEEEAEGYLVILDGQHRSTAFAKLNSVTFYLNLIIHSSQVDNEAFIINICQIACTINSFLVIRINGILNKCLLRNFGIIPIFKRYACTYNAYFALFIRLCNFILFVKDYNTHILASLTNRK